MSRCSVWYMYCLYQHASTNGCLLHRLVFIHISPTHDCDSCNVTVCHSCKSCRSVFFPFCKIDDPDSILASVFTFTRCLLLIIVELVCLGKSKVPRLYPLCFTRVCELTWIWSSPLRFCASDGVWQCKIMSRYKNASSFFCLYAFTRWCVHWPVAIWSVRSANNTD